MFLKSYFKSLFLSFNTLVSTVALIASHTRTLFCVLPLSGALWMSAGRSRRGTDGEGRGLHLSVGILCSKSCQRPSVRESAGSVSAFTTGQNKRRPRKYAHQTPDETLSSEEVSLKTWETNCAEKKTKNKKKKKKKKTQDELRRHRAGGRAHFWPGTEHPNRLVSPEPDKKPRHVRGELLCAGRVLPQSPGE